MPHMTIFSSFLPGSAEQRQSEKDDETQEPAVNLDSNGYLAFSENDPANPKSWSRARRWGLTVIISLLCLNATMASSASTAVLPSISDTFHVSQEVAGLTLTLFLLGYVAGPLCWAPLSEYYGRRPVLYISYSLYLAFLFLCAFAPNIGGLLVGRFLTGMFVSGTISNGPAVLVDMWEFYERGQAMALFAMTLFIGPAVSPVICGFFQLTENFRWAFYMLLWFGAVAGILMFLIPETYPPRRLVQKAKRLRRADTPLTSSVQAPLEANPRSLMSLFKWALSRPWIILFDPIAFFVAIYMSLIYMLLYMLFSIYPIVFQEKRGWNAGVGELPLLGIIVGTLIGGAIALYDSNRTNSKALKSGKPSRPEDRLHVAMLAGVLFPISMFFFAWTGEYNSVPWIVPTIAGSLISVTLTLTFISYLSYLTDSYLQHAASANAANTVVRSLCGAAAPLFDVYMFNALGIGGGGSLIGGVAALLAPVPFIFYWKGEMIRKKSRFAPTNT